AFGPDTICFCFPVAAECAAEEVLVALRPLFAQHGSGGARTGYRRAHAAHLSSHGGERAPLVDGHGGRGQCALAERRKMDVKPASAITVEPLRADRAVWGKLL